VRAQAAAEGARQAKDSARTAVEREVRPITNFVQGHPKTSNADRATIGITVRDFSGTPTPIPTTRPQTLVRVGGRLTHTLRLSAAPRSKPDESTWACRARPKGVLGAEVWVKLVDADQPAPTNPAALVFLTMTTRPTFRADFKPGEGGTKEKERAPSSWLARHGGSATGSTREGREKKRPWSEITTATVAA